MVKESGCNELATGRPALVGNTLHRAAAALLLIDVINDMEFPGADQMMQAALPMAEALAQLKQRAKRAEIPAIYVNDNFGRWRSDFRSQVNHCLHDHVRGQAIVEMLLPEEEDYFVLKPKHSGFYSTGLDELLRQLGADTLILTGIATNICVQFTATDAYLRDYRLFVPQDCVVASTEAENHTALQQMAKILKADIRLSTEMTLALLNRRRS